LGGWAGTISEVHRDGLYTVRWSRETLRSVHPIYKKRCAIDGTDLAEYRLGDDDLEPDRGGPLDIEHPTDLTPRPLSAEYQSDRVRMVFGLTSDDFLPQVDDDSLETYYDFLKERLNLPAEAKYHEEEEGFFDRSAAHPAKVVALDDELCWDEDEGILCDIRTAAGEAVVPLANLEFRRSNRNHKLADDYCTWLCGELSEDEDEDSDWDDDDFDDEPEDDDPESSVLQKPTWGQAALESFVILASATFIGAVAGSALAAMAWAKWGALIGGGLLAVLWSWKGSAAADQLWPLVPPRLRKACGVVSGAIISACIGAWFSIMAIALIGSIAGGIAGALLKPLVPRAGRRPRLIHAGNVVLAAASCGVAAQAFFMDFARATDGLLYGAAAGLTGGLLLGLASVAMAVLVALRVPRVKVLSAGVSGRAGEDAANPARCKRVEDACRERDAEIDK
jgi:hypothetical protein